MRILPLPEIIRKLNRMLAGYYRYYGITDNYERLGAFLFPGAKESVLLAEPKRAEEKLYLGWLQRNAEGISTSAPQDLCQYLRLTAVEQLALQRAGCGKAARPDL